MIFDVSGVEVAWWIPPLAAFFISLIFSTGGVSGAFILLPFQISVLGFVSPAVTSTNHLFNVIAIPGGVYRFIKEKRMLWPLAIVTVAGTLPGVIIGIWIRVKFLPDPRTFKLFVGCVLFLIGGRLLWQNVLRSLLEATGLVSKKPKESMPKITKVEVTEFSWHRISYKFSGHQYNINSIWLFTFTTIVGLIGGAYGVGEGSIIAPLLVTMFGFDIYTITGVILMGTYMTSSFAVII